MFIRDFLIAKKEDRELIYGLWKLLGAPTCHSESLYISNQIQLVQVEGSQLNNHIVYCINDQLKPVPWKDCELIDGNITLSNIASRNFYDICDVSDILQNPPQVIDFGRLREILVSDDIGTPLRISEYDFNAICSEAGIPYLSLDELELSFAQICNVCILPALDEYYKHFPIVKDVPIGPYTSNQEFDIILPEGCHDAILYMTMGTQTDGGANGQNPLSMLRESLMYGTYGSNYGNRWGMRTGYHEVPGWTGESSGARYSGQSQKALRQSNLNMIRREHYRREVDEEHRVHIKGYSTIGGLLNGKFLCHSNYFDDVDYESKTNVRKLATSKVLRFLGMLRGSVETKLQTSEFISRATTLETEVQQNWNQSSINQAFAIGRGGLNK